ncbi:MAG: hypothetical protein IKW92_04770 [Firmicutes bacterium]|nr:hypothetical protein [Bacillota bacterium]
MYKKNLWLVIIVIFLVLVLLPVTPQRAVRLWLVKDFQPAAAFRVKLQSDPVAISEYDQPRYTSENMERYRVDTEHYLPLWMDTKNPMIYWDIKKSGIFYSAEPGGAG